MKTIIVGTDSNPGAYGALECDIFEQLPSIYEEDYVHKLLNACINNSVDIVIPGLDDDVLILSKQRSLFHKHNIKLICSDSELVTLCRDKGKLFDKLSPFSKNLARTFTPEKALTALENNELSFPCIAKPKAGSGSLGLKLIRDKSEILVINNQYIIQELLYPDNQDPNRQKFIAGLAQNRILQISEISIQVLSDSRGRVLGRMASRNRLKNGAPVEILPIDNNYIWKAVDELQPKLQKLGMRGPLNIQGRLTDDGIKFFEINPRFTGITGIRAMLGFNEVEACIKSFLGVDSGSLSLGVNHNKFACRQLAEKCGFFETDQKKILLITGSTGYLGSNFLKTISDRKDYTLWTLDRDRQPADNLQTGPAEKSFTTTDMRVGNIPWGQVDILLHMGFARPYCSSKEIADSLSFTKNLFKYAGEHNIPSVINISSQSVYGQASLPLWDEKTPVSPETPYAMAKYAGELYLQSEQEKNRHLKTTSLRLAALTGSQNGLINKNDLVSRFVQQALENRPISIHGHHTFEKLDIRDAIEALIKLLDMPHCNWKKIYNLGNEQPFTIIELSETVLNLVEQNTGIKGSYRTELKDQKQLSFGMNSQCFFQDSGWKPQYSLGDSIESLIEYMAPK